MSTETKTQPTFSEVMDKAAKSALRGGTAGAVAMGLNVGALMWMRTTVRFMLEFRIFCHFHYKACIADLIVILRICILLITSHVCYASIYR